MPEVFGPVFGTSSLTSLIGGSVNVYADLPDASLNIGKIFYVITGSGIWFINRKDSGWYYSNGTNWIQTPDIESYFENVLDSSLTIKDDIDRTKQFQFQLSNIPSNSLKTFTLPNSNIDFSNITFVSSESDLPTQTDISDGLGTAHHLVQYQKYVITKSFSCQYPIVARDNFIESHYGVVITYTGSNAFFRNNTNSPCGVIAFNLCFFMGTGTNQLFNITAGNSIAPNLSSFIYFDLGTIQDIDGFGLESTSFLSQTGPLILTSVETIYFNIFSCLPSSAISDSLIKIYGSGNDVADFINFRSVPYSGDDFIHLDSSFDGFFTMSHGKVDTSLSGNAFSSSGLNERSVEVDVRVVGGVSDSNIIASMAFEKNLTPTTIQVQGQDGTITGFSDAGGGNTTVLTSTTPADGSIVWISVGNYAGKYTTFNTVLNTSFDIIKEYVGTETSEWEIGWTKILGTTIALENERAAMTANNQLTFYNLREKAVIGIVTTNPRNESVASAKDWQFALMKNDKRLYGSLKQRQMLNIAGEGMIAVPTTVISSDFFEVYTRNMSDTTAQIMRNMTVVIK